MVKMLDDSADTSPDWISAHQAYELVSGRNQDAYAATSIANRVHAGLVRSRAKLFILERAAARGGKEKLSQEWTDLPKEFWWASGGDALDQDWDAGDFATWIDGKFKWQAFGVKFDRSGIEAMLAPPMPEPESRDKIAENESNKGSSRSTVKSRKLAHDHPYVAAKTVLDLLNLPDAERNRLTGPSVGRTMRDYYEQNAGHAPHDDNLDNYGESVLRALKEYWQR